MVNNILSIINLILGVTALVIAIIALTNRNKDKFEPIRLNEFEPIRLKGNSVHIQFNMDHSGSPNWQTIANNNCFHGQLKEDALIYLKNSIQNAIQFTSLLYHMSSTWPSTPMPGATTDNLVIACSCANMPDDPMYVSLNPGDLESSLTSIFWKSAYNTIQFNLVPVDPSPPPWAKAPKEILGNVPYYMYYQNEIVDPITGEKTHPTWSVASGRTTANWPMHLMPKPGTTPKKYLAMVRFMPANDDIGVLCKQ